MELSELKAELETATTIEEFELLQMKIMVFSNIEREERDVISHAHELERYQKNNVQTVLDIKNRIDSKDFSTTEKKLLKDLLTINLGDVGVTPNNIYLHVDITGGDGRVPIGIKNNGTDSFSATITFKDGKTAEDNTITAINGIPYRVSIRNESEIVIDIVDVMFTSGVATMNYTTTMGPGVCHIDEQDFDILEMAGVSYKLRLVDPILWKVYRAL
jgi:hypothetical protein